MRKNREMMVAFAVLSMISVLGVSGWMAPNTVVPIQQGTVTPPPIEMPPPTEDSWVIIDLPEDATQLEYGEEVYRLVCKACHGDIGWGLTDEWRAQWEPKDQNCWQSKCHGENHPIDGFYMPGVPAVVGEPIRKFGNAMVLYTYNHNAMPYHDRGNMTEYESWAVTAYILKINGIDPPLELNAENAADIDLSVIDPDLGPTPTPQAPGALPAPEQVDTPAPIPTNLPEVQSAESNNSIWIYSGAVLFAIFIVAYIIFQRRRAAGT